MWAGEWVWTHSYRDRHQTGISGEVAQKCGDILHLEADVVRTGVSAGQFSDAVGVGDTQDCH
jgi:hypothetical protein